MTTLASVGLPRGSRIAVEKPFGQDYESAVALNRALADAIDAADERSTFGVDHVLGLATVQNLLGLRVANEFLEPAWTSAHVERIDVFWEETLALEGRADYYNRAGVLSAKRPYPAPSTAIELAGSDPHDHAEQEPERVQPPLPQRSVEGNDGGDGREERFPLRENVFRDQQANVAAAVAWINGQANADRALLAHRLPRPGERDRRCGDPSGARVPTRRDHSGKSGGVGTAVGSRHSRYAAGGAR